MGRERELLPHLCFVLSRAIFHEGRSARMVSPCWSVDAFLSGIIVPSTHQVGGFFFSGHKVAMTVAKRESGEESRAFVVSYASTIFIVRSPRMRVVPNGTGVRLLLSRRVTMFSVVRIVTPLVEKASSTQGPVSVTPTRMWVRESERVGSGRRPVALPQWHCWVRDRSPGRRRSSPAAPSRPPATPWVHRWRRLPEKPRNAEDSGRSGSG